MIIDVHAHILDTGYPVESTTTVNASEMVHAMDRHGISEMWVSPATAFVRDFVASNKYQYDFFKQTNYSRFRNYAVFNPYFPNETSEEIKRCFEEYGFDGIKIHNWMQGILPHQKPLYDIIEASIKYHVPVLFHDGTPPYSDTLQLSAIAEMYPEAKILLGHSGLYDSYRAAIQAANTHNNIWLVLIGPTVGDMEEIIVKSRRDRLLFGTDYCFGGGDWKGESLILDRIDIVKSACKNENAFNQIMFQNALDLIT